MAERPRRKRRVDGKNSLPTAIQTRRIDGWLRLKTAAQSTTPSASTYLVRWERYGRDRPCYVLKSLQECTALTRCRQASTRFAS